MGPPHFPFQIVAKKILSYPVVGVLYSGPGIELAAGDEAIIYLDQSRNPNLPATIEGIVQAVTPGMVLTQSGCHAAGTTYAVQYESEDLDGAANSIAACDVTDISGKSCCTALRDALNQEIAARTAADTELREDIEAWDTLTLEGEPESGVVGVSQVEVNSVTGSAPGSGTFPVTFTAAGLTGSPLELLVPVVAGDSPNVIAEKIAIAAAANVNLNAFSEFDNIGDQVAWKFRDPAANQPGANMGFGPFGGTPSTTLVSGVAPVAGDTPTRLGQQAQWGTRIWVATSINPPEWTELATEYNTYNFDPAITALTGTGGLDEMVVDATFQGRLQSVRVGDYLYNYVLEGGTDAESAPQVIRPDNYASPDTEFVWKLLSTATVSALVLDASLGGNGSADDGLLLKFGATGNIISTRQAIVQDPNTVGYAVVIQTVSGSQKILGVQNANTMEIVFPALTAARTQNLPNFSGTFSLDRQVAASVPTTGFTITAGTFLDQFVSLTPAGTLASGTFSLPSAANSRVGQKVTLFSTQIVTTFTVNVTGGGTLKGTAITTIAANASYEFICESVAGSGTWVRVR